jgi:hypothetical protein
VVEDHFSSPKIKEWFGGLILGGVPRDYTNAYKILRLPDTDDTKKASRDLITLTNKSKQEVGTFLHFLWFVKDNSVTYQDMIGYAYHQDGEDGYLHPVFFSNHSVIFNCNGEFQDDHFSLSELREAGLLLTKYNSLFPYKSENHAVPRSDYFVAPEQVQVSFTKSIDLSRNYNDFDRLERAMDFLKTARTIYYLPYRITMYVAVLECLFSTDDKDITYKVSQRVAMYLGGIKMERLLTAQTVKRAYNIRSKYIHAALMDDKHAKDDYLKRLSNHTDDIIRAILTRIINEDHYIFLQESNMLGVYFDNLIYQSAPDISDVSPKTDPQT